MGNARSALGWYRPSVGIPRNVGCRALVECGRYASNLDDRLDGFTHYTTRMLRNSAKPGSLTPYIYLSIKHLWRTVQTITPPSLKGK